MIKPIRGCLLLLACLMFSAPAMSQEKSAAAKSKPADPSQTEGVQLPPKEKFYLFLLVGQSNMAGRGKVEESDLATNPRILSLNKQNQWVLAKEPLHFDKPTVVGVGPGREFAVTILKSLPEDVTIGLIPCAVGGSAIGGWEPDGFDKPTKTYPYNDMLKRLQAAREVGEVKGILWHQGESDSSEALSQVYEQKLHTLIGRLRQECGNENIPFIAGQMGVFEGREWNEAKRRVDGIQKSLPEKISQTGYVDAQGLNHKGDLVHFDAESYRELGRRYARKFLKLTGSK